ARPGVRVEHRELELILGRLEIDEQVVDLVEHLGRARVAPVDLVDDDDGRQARLEGLLQHEAGLRQGPLGGVDQQQHAVDQRPLDLRAEVGMTGCVDDVDVDAAVRDGRVLGHDRDALLALEVDRVHDALGDRFVLAEEPRLPEHRVDQCGLAVVDMGDDRDVTNVLALLHQSILSRGRDGSGYATCIMALALHHLKPPPEVAHMRYLLPLALAVIVAAPGLAQDKPAAKAPTAVMTLENGGVITLEFFPADAPKHVENFLKLAREGFYDGQRFHRVEPGFVVQIGDPQSKTQPMNAPGMGTGGPGYTIKAEFNKRPFERGILGMARSSDPDSAGSQFYIMLGAAGHLNGQYTAFGRVVRGMDVVDKIKVGDRVKSVKVN